MSERQRRVCNCGSVAFVILSSVSVWVSKVFGHNIITKRTGFYGFHVSQRKNLFLEDLISLFDWHTFIWLIFLSVDLYPFFLWLSQLTEDLPENQLHLVGINPDIVLLKVLYQVCCYHLADSMRALRVGFFNGYTYNSNPSFS